MSHNMETHPGNDPNFSFEVSGAKFRKRCPLEIGIFTGPVDRIVMTTKQPARADHF